VALRRFQSSDSSYRLRSFPLSFFTLSCEASDRTVACHLIWIGNLCRLELRRSADGVEILVDIEQMSVERFVTCFALPQ
jgi:hypothetical protein